MTVSATLPSSSHPSVAAYENLRCQALAGTAIGSHFGLVLILREGVAAWVSRCATSTSLDPAAAAQPRAPAPNMSDGIRTSVVQVLASMVFRGLGETSS